MTLGIGSQAPALDLDALNGGRPKENGKLKLAIFFKTNCPTCQYSWPFYERLYSAYRDAGLEVVGISQHDRERTTRYQDQFHSSFPLLLDADLSVSKEYDPEFVPTAFLIGGDGKIQATLASWNKNEFEQLGQRIAGDLKVKPKPLFRASENVVAFKPG